MKTTLGSIRYGYVNHYEIEIFSLKGKLTYLCLAEGRPGHVELAVEGVPGWLVMPSGTEVEITPLAMEEPKGWGSAVSFEVDGEPFVAMKLDNDVGVGWRTSWYMFRWIVDDNLIEPMEGGWKYWSEIAVNDPQVFTWKDVG